MDTLLANRCPYFQGLRSHDLEGRPPCRPKIQGRAGAPPSMITKSLRAFFERGGFTAQVSQRFAGEMK
jgi:hypothetical protein